MPYLTALEVVYGDEPANEPANAVQEIQGLSNNINDSFGGQHVWLVPYWTTTDDWRQFKESTLVKIEVTISEDRSYDEAMRNLAEGADGYFRYIVTRTARDDDAPERITEIALMRGTPEEMPKNSWDGISENINAGRGDKGLYLVWKSCIPPPDPGFALMR